MIENNIDKQLDLNVVLEECVLDYLDKKRKLDKYLGFCKTRLNIYNSKIKKAEKIEADSEELKTRAYIYIETCKRMYSSFKLKIEETEDQIKLEYKKLKDDIFYKLNDALANNLLDKNTIVSLQEKIVYSVPSARFIFENPVVEITNEKELKNFLFSNNLDYFNEDHSIKFEDFEKELVICDDCSIVYEPDGIVVDGVDLTDTEMVIQFT